VFLPYENYLQFRLPKSETRHPIRGLTFFRPIYPIFWLLDASDESIFDPETSNYSCCEQNCETALPSGFKCTYSDIELYRSRSNEFEITIDSYECSPADCPYERMFPEPENA